MYVNNDDDDDDDDVVVVPPSFGFRKVVPGDPLQVFVEAERRGGGEGLRESDGGLLSSGSFNQLKRPKTWRFAQQLMFNQLKTPQFFFLKF